MYISNEARAKLFDAQIEYFLNPENFRDADDRENHRNCIFGKFPNELPIAEIMKREETGVSGDSTPTLLVYHMIDMRGAVRLPHKQAALCAYYVPLLQRAQHDPIVRKRFEDLMRVRYAETHHFLPEWLSEYLESVKVERPRDAGRDEKPRSRYANVDVMEELKVHRVLLERQDVMLKTILECVSRRF